LILLGRISACDQRAGNRGILILCSVVVHLPVRTRTQTGLRRCACFGLNKTDANVADELPTLQQHKPCFHMVLHLLAPCNLQLYFTGGVQSRGFEQ